MTKKHPCELQIQLIGTPDDIRVFTSFLEAIEGYVKSYHARVAGKYYPVSGPLYCRKYCEIDFRKDSFEEFIKYLRLPPDEP
ncbi:hypothetical protein IQ247_18085 [Plectonema cf. radiosum LEGE 06105]|uniref:Uncharacterized protein n=1 Tax=Plectonema cf. radiosum LEGE 06105 TaxID=945769 RepID=A0A8J7F9A7_9CYAN|nr:hypothetical protein [Plectonema radiosum]MBE9214554.1 hypothetical protein [Plectonema cf. radiosum LEGE 06105]